MSARFLQRQGKEQEGESFVRYWFYYKGQHCLGDRLTPGTLEGWGAVSAWFPWPPSWVASLFALAEME